jgi:hypothetical protein
MKELQMSKHILRPGHKHSKFSHVTRPVKSLRKLPRNPTKPRGSSEDLSEEVGVISKERETCDAVEKSVLPDKEACLVACDSLGKMELRNRYAAEAIAHRNMKQRQKSKGAVVHAAFEEFSSFLRHVGPIPAKGATLDRIHNDDPEYGPGKVRWADKHTQNNNKSDTLIFYYSRTGDTYTTSRLAKLQKVTPGTIRQRRNRGWTDDEIIENNRASAEQPISRQTPPGIKTSPPRAERDMSCGEVIFRRMAEGCEHHRQEHGEEDLPADHAVLAKYGVTERAHEAHFRRLWPDYRPHIYYERLSLVQQALIKKIDPEYVDKYLAKMKSKQLLSEKI